MSAPGSGRTPPTRSRRGPAAPRGALGAPIRPSRRAPRPEARTGDPEETTPSLRRVAPGGARARVRSRREARSGPPPTALASRRRALGAGPPAPARAGGPPRMRRYDAPVFERFTERARQAVVLAQDEARRLRHDHLGPEHLLLGLLREEEGVAAHVLGAFGVALEPTRSEVTRLEGAGGEGARAQTPFTPPAKKVLERALREALALGHTYIGTEHILLGLCGASDGVAAAILGAFGVSAGAARERVTDLLGR